MMSGHHIVFVHGGGQVGQAPQARQAPPAPQAAPAPPAARAAASAQADPTREQLREQIRQTIQDATRSAREAQAQDPVSISVNRQGIRVNGRPVLAGEHQPDLPGMMVRRGGMDDVIPPQAVDISIAFFIMTAVIIIGWPIARAFGRRIERRSESPTVGDPAMGAQLQRIEQAVEAMSIEIERISESQRFMAKLQNGAAPERAVLAPGERR